MPLYHKPHFGHDKHLCKLIEDGATFDDYYNLIKNPEFICRLCGRVASKDENLCEPTRIPSSR